MRETEIIAEIREIAERLNQLFPKVYRPGRTPEEQMVFTFQESMGDKKEKVPKNGDLRSFLFYFYKVVSESRLLLIKSKCVSHKLS